MFRLIRNGIIVIVTLVGLLLWASPAEAAGCLLTSSFAEPICAHNLPPVVFAEPEPFINSFLPNMTYARLRDNINVYEGPSLGSGIVRNVGDGFLFATVLGVVENEGKLWYNINFGEYVQASDLILVEDSSFTGYEILQQPERPFGWMVVDYWYSDEPGAEKSPESPKLPRYTFVEIFDAVEADDGWIWYNIGAGRWMRQTYLSLIDVQERPEEIGAGEFWVDIDLYEQTFSAYIGDEMVYAGLVSSGLNQWPTHEGLFQVWSRHTRAKMSGAEGKIDYYFIEDVPHTMYFDQDIALHGAYWHDRFGYKHSHGCVNMPPRAAEWVFNWSEDAPNDLWVRVHTSNPNSYFDRYDPVLNFVGG